MFLKSIQIKNFRSIEDLTIKIDQLPDRSMTYGLIGVNEAGKSSILQALALNDGLIIAESIDFHKGKPIQIIYSIRFDARELVEFNSTVSEPSQLLEIRSPDVDLSISYEQSSPSTKAAKVTVDGQDIIKDPMPGQSELIVKFTAFALDKLPKSIFWSAEDKFLISKPIILSDFASSPKSISVPLKNCFHLAGYIDIAQSINELSGSTDKEELQTKLGDEVTAHIRSVWPSHPIKITFLIDNNQINFHVKDEDTKEKAKTAEQRSDGFKQFISFLLTVSAESKNEELSNSIILLDEPETHLHPMAQEYLLNELISITRNARNNIAFFATHSNYMIDKQDLSRNHKVVKEGGRSKCIRLDGKKSSYASVTYEVFELPTNDYHNELYGSLQEKFELYKVDEFDDYLHKKGIAKDMNYIKLVKGKGSQAILLTLPTYIRNRIHHPENPENRGFMSDELKRSIDLLRNLDQTA